MSPILFLKQGKSLQSLELRALTASEVIFYLDHDVQTLICEGSL